MNSPGLKTLAEWDHRYVWHPFTQMQDWLAEDPVVIERGEGNELIDVNGNRYLDGVSSLWCNLHGHRKRELDEALHAQIDRIAHTTTLGLTNLPSVLLAKRLVEIAPEGLTRVFYSDDGATAAEIALKMAFQYCQLRGEHDRTKFASLAESYHGDTIGSVSLGYSEGFHRYYRPILFPVERIRPPHVFRFLHGMSLDDALATALDEARRVLGEHARELAGVFAEPLIQGAAGMWDHSPVYLRGLREITRELGILLIVDEVATGFGRTGTMFACEQAGITPDLMCVAKGITGGYLPLAATFATDEIFEAFLGKHEELNAFFHGHTYTGNPLGCAVALANLDVFEQERIIERLPAKIKHWGTRLAEEVAPLPWVADVRGQGLMTGVELMRNPEKRLGFELSERIGHRVVLEARQRGVAIRPLGSVIILMPPLSITDGEIDRLVGVTAESIRAACS